MADKDEAAFRVWMRECWSGWIDFHEPGRGSGNGFPDCELLLPLTKMLLPIELKVGTIVKERVFPKRVRPSQVQWHMKFSRAGGRALICVGVYVPTISNFIALLVDGSRAPDWRAGFPITRERPMLAQERFEAFVLREFDEE